MYQEEVFEELKEDPYFQEYTMEQCQQDLAALASWGNLLTIQDTRKVTTIEEFKNKKFRYQLSETAVEVERMVIRIEKSVDRRLFAGADFIGAASDQPWKAGGDVTGRSGKAVRMVE